MDEVKSALSSDPRCGPNCALSFILWKSAKKKKNLHQAQLRLQEHELERAEKRMNSVLGENLGCCCFGRGRSHRVHVHSDGG